MTYIRYDYINQEVIEEYETEQELMQSAEEFYHDTFNTTVYEDFASAYDDTDSESNYDENYTVTTIEQAIDLFENSGFEIYKKMKGTRIMQPLIKTNDRKQTLTLKEVKQVEEELKKETVIVNNGTDTKLENNKIAYFYWFRVNKFENLPLFIGKVHEQFGRKIDIRTYFCDDNTIELYFRGNSQELR